MSSPPLPELSAIPTSSTRTVIDDHVPTLVWIVEGEASISGGIEHRTVSAGDALWIPADTRAIVRGSEGGCIIPIRMRDADRLSGPTEPFTTTVPPSSHDALLAAFTRSLGVLHGGGVRAASVFGWIQHPSASINAPSAPVAPDLRSAAEDLLAHPDASPTEIGAAHGLGPGVLARRFRSETGWTPLRWRARHLLADAAALIRSGTSVTAAAATVGYSSPQAFARAFRREWGIAPAALIGDGAERRADPISPRRRSAEIGPQRSGYHIVLWAAAGTATIRIDGHESVIRTGDIACLPAGTDAGLSAPADSVVLPLGWLPGGITVRQGVVARAAAHQHSALLRLSAWTYAEVTPADSDEPRIALQHALGLAEPGEIVPSLADATYALLNRLMDDPADGRSTSELAAQLGLPPVDLRDAVEALTGTSLATWRARTRMSLARRLLRDGLHATQVAQRLGYADAAGFSRAFTRAHGFPPSHFQTGQRRATPH